MLTTVLLSTIVPIVTDFLKASGPALSRRVFGETVEDQIKLENIQIERLKALAALDTPGGTPSQWVVDLRAAFRYVSAAALILGGLGIAAYGSFGVLNPELVVIGIDLAASPFGFIFGERLVLNRRNATGK